MKIFCRYLTYICIILSSGLIPTAIASNLPELAIEFPVGRLCARYAQQTVPNQKKILKSLERAAVFKKNRDAFLRARQQVSDNSLRAGAQR